VIVKNPLYLSFPDKYYSPCSFIFHSKRRTSNLTITLQLVFVGQVPKKGWDAHQSFATGYPGSFGGNMDYNQIREGTTVYLPVSAPGALLFIGDGHAAQGDGELTGDALETSMDVEFSVALIKGFATVNPRFENDEY